MYDILDLLSKKIFQGVFYLKHLTDMWLYTLSYARSTHSEDTSLQWYCPLNIYETSPSSVMATLLATHPHGGNVTIQIFCFLWQGYSYPTLSSMTEFSYLTPISVSLLKPLLRVIHWNPRHLLYLLLIYKTSSYTIIC